MEDKTLHRRPRITTQDGALPPEQEIDLASTIEKPELIVGSGEDMNSIHTKEYARDLAFMEDIVEFVVSESEDKNAPNPVTCGNQGVIHFIERGKPYRLARKFIDSMINTVFRIETETYKDKYGLDQTRMKKIPTNAYNISILSDPAGETGRRWFLHKLQNG